MLKWGQYLVMFMVLIFGLESCHYNCEKKECAPGEKKIGVSDPYYPCECVCPYPMTYNADGECVCEVVCYSNYILGGPDGHCTCYFNGNLLASEDTLQMRIVPDTTVADTIFWKLDNPEFSSYSNFEGINDSLQDFMRIRIPTSWKPSYTSGWPSVHNIIDSSSTAFLSGHILGYGHLSNVKTEFTVLHSEGSSIAGTGAWITFEGDILLNGRPGKILSGLIRVRDRD